MIYRLLMICSLPIVLLISTKSIANNSYHISDKLSEFILEAERADIDAKWAAIEAEIVAFSGEPGPWLFMGIGSNAVEYYLDITSIKSVSGIHEPLRYEDGSVEFANSYKKAWWKVVGANGEHAKIQTKFYCDKDVIFDITSAIYDVNNNYLGRINKPKKLEPIVPETIFSNLSAHVCDAAYLPYR